MKTVNVAELEGVALDYSVAVATGLETVVCGAGEYRHDIKGGIHCSPFYGCGFGAPSFGGDWGEYSPSADWSQGGPLIGSHKVDLSPALSGNWIAECFDCLSLDPAYVGPTPLIAACRAIVAAKFGDTVEVPEELL